MFGRENQVNRNNVSEHECLKVEARQEHLHVFLLGCNVHPPISKSNDQSQISEITNQPG